MPVPDTASRSDALLAAMASRADGLSLDELAQVWAEPLSRRSLQRRLAALVQSGQAVATGRGRATRYLAGATAATPPPAAASARTAGIPLSGEAEAVRVRISQPRAARTPVGYQQAFLATYQPNVSSYLPAALREQLHEMGRWPSGPAPAGTFARDILNRLLVDLSWSSSRLEGNTYSRLDTERLIEFGTAAEGKDAVETQMILNHKAAIEYLVRLGPEIGIDRDTLIALHALLADGLMPDPAAVGRLRRRPVEIGGSVYLPIAMPQRLDELFGVVVGMAGEIADPFEQAFFLMVHLPYLQPFEDVNKRVSRLAANIPLMRHNLCPLSFIDVPAAAYVEGLLAVYELNRIELLREVFAWAYERSCQQYLAVQQQLVPPDALRLRYRRELSAVVTDIVRGGLPADAESVNARLPASIAADDSARFAALVLKEFRGLHAGNAVRFGLGGLEFAAWQGGSRPASAGQSARPPGPPPAR
ncbi:MAG TPA: Fic family protein [Ideonella sp.]|nr:Fic family protein [Ideonella sp.]